VPADRPDGPITVEEVVSWFPLGRARRRPGVAAHLRRPRWQDATDEHLRRPPWQFRADRRADVAELCHDLTERLEIFRKLRQATYSGSERQTNSSLKEAVKLSRLLQEELRFVVRDTPEDGFVGRRARAALAAIDDFLCAVPKPTTGRTTEMWVSEALEWAPLVARILTEQAELNRQLKATKANRKQAVSANVAAKPARPISLSSRGGVVVAVVTAALVRAYDRDFSVEQVSAALVRAKPIRNHPKVPRNSSR
jgi:hypothetical protein